MTQDTQHAVVNVIGYLNEKDINLLSLNILEPNVDTSSLTIATFVKAQEDRKMPSSRLAARAID